MTRKPSPDCMESPEEQPEASIPLSLDTVQILDCLPDNVILQDCDHNVLWVNRAALQEGLTVADYCGRKCHEIWHGREVPCSSCPTEEALESGLMTSRISITPDDRQWEIRAGPVRGQSARHIAGIKIVRDVTARVRAEQARDRFIRELSRKNEELERFADVISHDLRSPLTTIGGFAALLQRQIASGDTEQAVEFLQRIGTAAVQMEDMIEGLLDLSRAGRPVGDPARVSLDDLTSAAVLLASGDAEQRDVRLCVASGQPEVLGDRERLLHVYLNLLSNGIRHGAAVSGAEVHIAARPGADGTVLCTVSDTGAGVLGDNKDRIFDPFEQGKGGGKAGLGLSIVRRIVEAHGGEVSLQSPGEHGGCTFQFTLPAAS